MLELLFLIIGISGLWFGAELVIRGILNIGEHYKISYIFLGLTVLAFGSDLPEFVINIIGAIKKLGGIDTSGLIVGDAVGSCFGQIGLILGIVGLFGILIITKKELIRDGLTMLGAVVVLFLVSFNGHISRIEGIILIIIYIFYIAALFREEKLHEKIPKAPQFHPFWSIISLIGGFTLLYFASTLTIDNALILSDRWGVAQSLIGVLIVGIGTSLPELAISLTAIRKKAGSMAIGNLIGSNIFDTLIPIGAAAGIAELNISNLIRFYDIPALFVLSAIVLLIFRKKKVLQKKGAITLIVLFLIYAAIKIIYFHGIFIPI